MMWSNEDFQWLSSLANIVSICIELRKNKDDAVRERSFLSNLFRYMPLGYIRLSILKDAQDKPCDYFITDANQHFADVLGRPMSEFVGKAASYFYKDTTQMLNYLLDILANGSYKEAVSYTHLKNIL